MKFTLGTIKSKGNQEGETIGTQAEIPRHTTVSGITSNYQWPAIIAPDLHFQGKAC